MKSLIIIYSPDLEDLLKFKPTATHWLPENFKNQPLDLYHPPNIICTTKNTMIEFIRISIQAGTINHLNVVWIKAGNPNITYTFDASGQINNFFSF